MSQKLTKQRSSKKSEQPSKPSKQDSKASASKAKPKSPAKSKRGTRRTDPSKHKDFLDEEPELPSDEESYQDDSDSEDEEDDSHDDVEGLIAPEEEIQKEHEAAQELERIESKKLKARMRRKKLKADNDGVDSEDIQIINENLPQKRRRLIQEPDSDQAGDPVAKLEQSWDEDGFKKSSKHNQIKAQDADEQDEESEQEGSEEAYEASDNHDNYQSKSREFQEDKHDFDEVFGHPDDSRIADLDIPERLQVKIGTNRMNPSLDQLKMESEWIFKNILEELRYNRNPNLYDDIKLKIMKVLTKILCQYGDIPWICRYAKEFYQPELEQKDVWRIYQLDIEYGKLQSQKQKILEFFEGLEEFAKDDVKSETFQHYKNRITSTESLRELNGFQSLMSFYRSYYQKEIEQKVYRESKQSNNGQKAPVPRRDFIFLSRQRKLDEFSKRCMLAPVSLAFNIQADQLVHSPNQPQNIDPLEMAREYQSNEPMKAVKDMCQYTATEIMSLPEVRQGYKKFVYQYGFLRTEPTQKGAKELDVCHPCYRVKRVNKRLSELMKTDLFLDILENESQGLIKFSIKVESSKDESKNKNNISCPYFQGIFEKFTPSNDTSKWFIPRREVFGILSGDFHMATGVKENFSQSIIGEIKLELKEDAENFVIQQCTKKYADLIQKSYFKIDRRDNFQLDDDKRDDRIPQRTKYNVMGASIMQIDARNYQVTTAVVDDEGEYKASQDFHSIIPPRESRPEKVRPGEQEERKKHAYEKQIFHDLIRQHQIDLIVVQADCLEARKLKSALSDIVKMFLSEAQDYKKDIQVIWGRPEVPKLFSDSNNSMKLLKGQVNNLKKVVCLARFEQDPMNEVLNLWSPIIKENQALNLQLHSLQKQVNQVKLLESLEEVNIQTVNEVGIDINFLKDHEHYHNQLQFLSGLGPRKALRYIQKLKAMRKPIYNREMIEKESILGKKCYGCSAGFTKVRVPKKDLIFSKNLPEIRSIDQTRIHPSKYDTVYDIFADLKEDDQTKEQDTIDDKKQKGFKIVEEIIAKPKKLAEIAKTDFVGDIIKKLDKPGLSDLVRQVLDDLMQPFMDFREREDISRNPELPEDQEKYNNITGPTPNRLIPKELFYYLIDETEKTFKAGMIVQATVIRTYQSQMQDQNGKLLCRLDNGLDAFVHETDADPGDWQDLKKASEGRVITGRIVQFSRKSGEEDTFKTFSVNLICKRERLCRHEIQDLEELGYHIDEVPEADKINQNFAAEEERAQVIDHQFQQRPNFPQKIQIQRRNIDHPRFKNIQSREASALLKSSDIGQIIFRPSTRGPNHLNCTWKFFENIIVHLDIDEKDSRLPGANIGSKLWISDESFDNLQEIIERYITPCNRLLREALVHAKFLNCEKIDQLETFLKKEKAEEQQKIPYRLTLHDGYPQYLILGYIPKDALVKEFIKVKPRGFFFHHQYFTTIPELLNWFKAQFRSPEYQRYLRKVSAPKPATYVPHIPTQSQLQEQEQNAKMLDAQRFGTQGGLEYGIDNSANQDHKQKAYGRGGFRGEPKPVGNQNQGRNSPQYGNSPNGSNDSKKGFGGDRAYGRGKRGGRDEDRSKQVCWNCGSNTHFARECPEPKKDRGQKRFRDRSDSADRGEKRQRYDDGGGGVSSFRVVNKVSSFRVVNNNSFRAANNNSFRAANNNSFRAANGRNLDQEPVQQYAQQQYQGGPGQYIQSFQQQNQMMHQQFVPQPNALPQQPPRMPQQPPRLPQPKQQNN